MKRLALLAVVLGATACGAQPSRDAVTTPWSPVARACDGGGRACVSAVAAAMDRRYRALAAACDHDAPFALMYLRVTQQVGREEASFAAPRYLARLDARFARLYFDAFDAWRAGGRAQVPEAWQIAFEASARGRVSGIGDLLLGMNAHISRDLPFAVASLGAPAAAARASFERVNAVLERVARPMLREMAARFDPTISRFSLPVLDASPQTLGAVLSGWRDAALRDADRLLAARTPAARRTAADAIERNAAARAALIAAATSRVPYGPAGKARDAACRDGFR